MNNMYFGFKNISIEYGRKQILSNLSLEIPKSRVVTLIGRDGDEEIRVDALADLLDTIHYEIVCGISKRVTRVYKKDGREDSVFDCILDQP